MSEWMRFLPWGMSLHQAAQFDKPDRIRKLLSRGADVNAPDGKGITPLFYTANKGGLEATELLLAAGADINASVPGGGTPLHSALLKRHAKLALFFIERGADIRKATAADVNPLHMACFYGMADVARALLARGADIHALTEKQQSPFLLSLMGMLAWNTDGECARLLLHDGADPRIGTEDLAGQIENPPIAALLREELNALGQRTEEPALRDFCQKILALLPRETDPENGEPAILSAALGTMRNTGEKEDNGRYWCESGEYWMPYRDSDGDYPKNLDGRRYAGRNLSRRPWKNADPEQLGVSDAQFDAWEKGVGFPLPTLYREHMKQQNGGHLHFESFLASDKQLHAVFVNDAVLDCIPKNGAPIPFSEECDYVEEEDWNAIFGEGHRLDRLYILSHMYGHSLLCLDYGCTKSAPLAEPEVCLLDEEFADVFRAPSYENFVQNLVYGGFEWHLGVKTNRDLDDLARHISTRLGGRWERGGLEAHTDDHYGWYNYERWYSDTLFRKEGNALISLLPNRFRIGTHAFADHRDCPYILKMDPRKSDIYANRHADRDEMKALMRRLEADDIALSFILPE
jgi:hypothetical protein